MRTVGELRGELAAMLNPDDIPGTWTARDRDAHDAKRVELTRRIAAATQAQATLAEFAPKVEAATKWRGDLDTWRDAIAEEYLALAPRDPRHRNLELSIRVIDTGLRAVQHTGYALETLRLGDLMRTSGYVQAPPESDYQIGTLPWHGSIAEVDYHLEGWRERITIAEATLAEVLLEDDAREQLAAKRAEERAAVNARPQRKTRGDGSEFDKYPDGRVVEVTS